AFLNKKTYNLDELKEIFPKVDKNKKNIVVMSHAFSDAPHVGEGLLFKDYYDFLVKTLIHLNKNKEVNVFVKAHPSSYMWNEKGAVEELLENYQLGNIYILPNNLNTNSIVNFADYIVTAKGTAGLEFSCLGIPAVTAGKGYYYGFGIAKEPDTVEEYYSMLDNITKIDRLNSETINRALVLLYMVAQSRRHSKILPRSHIMPGEIYSEVYLDKYKEIIENFKNGEAMKDSFYEEIKNDVVNSNV
ncbi:capsule polysaccharide biosynthesis family protein, partial [Acinetobacter baumannii 1032359]